MSYYRPAFISQFGWGTPFDDENCAATAGAILLDRQTEGRKTSTPPKIRGLIDSPNKSGGLTLSDVEVALKRGYDENIVNPLPYEPWETFLAKFREGRGAIIFGDCKTKRGRMNCPGPKGELPPNHALYCQEDDKDGGRIFTYDPADRTAATGLQWLSYATVLEYAQAWTGKLGYVNAAYSRVTSPDSNGGDGEPTYKLDAAGCLGQFISPFMRIRNA